MVSMLSTAASGMKYYQTVLNVAADNIANVNSPAFKRLRIVSEGTPRPAILGENRNGVGAFTIDRFYEVGRSLGFDDPLAFAIQDDAFVRVTSQNGEPMLSRAGKLEMDSDGQLTIGGNPLDPPVTMPAETSQPQIGNDGTITALNADFERVEIGRLAMVRFGNIEALEAAGGGFYFEGEGVGDVIEGAPDDGTFAPIVVNALEGANVELTFEFTTMLRAQRAYQGNIRSFKVGDDMLALAADLTQ